MSKATKIKVGKPKGYQMPSLEEQRLMHLRQSLVDRIARIDAELGITRMGRAKKSFDLSLLGHGRRVRSSG